MAKSREKDKKSKTPPEIEEPFCTTAPDPEHHRGGFSPEDLDPCYDYRAGEMPGGPGGAEPGTAAGGSPPKDSGAGGYELPVPAHYEPARVDKIWSVPYLERARGAEAWAREHGLRPAYEDERRICLLCVDIQNTFCTPGFELFVAGRSGNAAVEDNRRLCDFIYRNLSRITRIVLSMDSHIAMQVFHPFFLVNPDGEHPEPLTVVTLKDVKEGRWRVNPDACRSLGLEASYALDYLERYTRELEQKERYALTVWPYHGMLGGIGHCIVPAVEEAVFFHTVARKSQADFELKGGNPLTESYSALGPEVLEGPNGRRIGLKNRKLFTKLKAYDALLIAGQAKSHCVAWTVQDLLEDFQEDDPDLARNVYLLEDCTSPVVVPGTADYTDEADAAFERFRNAGMHMVRSTDPMTSWPGMG